MNHNDEAGIGRRYGGDRLMTLEEVGDYLQVPVKTLYDWRARVWGRRGCGSAATCGTAGPMSTHGWRRAGIPIRAAPGGRRPASGILKAHGGIVAHLSSRSGELRWPTSNKRPYVGKDGKEKIYSRARYRDPQGKERVKTFVRRVEAERFLTGIEHAKLRGEWTEPQLGKIRFADYAADWLPPKPTSAPRRSPTSRVGSANTSCPASGPRPCRRSVRPTCATSSPAW